jgi:DNA-binding SARP family transcriptional activator
MRQLEYVLSVLGGFRLEQAAVFVALPVSCKRLVALLAVDGPQSRAEAAAKLWPDGSQDRAAANLRTVIWRLRRLAEDLLAVQGDLLDLRLVRCDLDLVRDWVRAVVPGDQPWPLPQHVGAELLPTWGEEWLVEPREELRLQELHALESAAQGFLLAGRFAEACSTALTAVGMDPLRESSTRLLIEIHMREGNTLEALRRFLRFRSLLEREAGVEPSPAVTALVSSLAPVRLQGEAIGGGLGHRA